MPEIVEFKIKFLAANDVVDEVKERILEFVSEMWDAEVVAEIIEE